jgi:hypothetical protein
MSPTVDAQTPQLSERERRMLAMLKLAIAYVGKGVAEHAYDGCVVSGEATLGRLEQFVRDVERPGCPCRPGCTAAEGETHGGLPEAPGLVACRRCGLAQAAPGEALCDACSAFGPEASDGSTR